MLSRSWSRRFCYDYLVFPLTTYWNKGVGFLVSSTASESLPPIAANRHEIHLNSGLRGDAVAGRLSAPTVTASVVMSTKQGAASTVNMATPRRGVSHTSDFINRWSRELFDETRSKIGPSRTASTSVSGESREVLKVEDKWGGRTYLGVFTNRRLHRNELACGCADRLLPAVTAPAQEREETFSQLFLWHISGLWAPPQTQRPRPPQRRLSV